MRKELLRQTIHLTYGIGFTFLCVRNAWIGVFVSLVLIAGALAHRRSELPFIGALITKLERTDDPLPGFGAITITVGIASVVLVFPEYGLIAGLGVAIIDSVATVIGLFGDGTRKKIAASVAGGVLFFIVTTSTFSEITTLRLVIASLAGALAEFFTSHKMLIDDNITVPWAIALALTIV